MDTPPDLQFCGSARHSMDNTEVGPNQQMLECLQSFAESIQKALEQASSGVKKFKSDIKSLRNHQGPRQFLNQLPELKATIMKRKEQNKAVRKPYPRQRQTTTIPHRHMKDYFFDDVPVHVVDLDASQTPSKMEESGIGDDGKDNFIDFDINFSMADLLQEEEQQADIELYWASFLKAEQTRILRMQPAVSKKEIKLLSESKWREMSSLQKLEWGKSQIRKEISKKQKSAQFAQEVKASNAKFSQFLSKRITKPTSKPQTYVAAPAPPDQVKQEATTQAPVTASQLLTVVNQKKSSPKKPESELADPSLQQFFQTYGLD